ncbi:hypothetical protein [Streptomyces sp. NPDC023838]|uniref:hypothetical protein n=1 Tax=Streptomyces sp. NPDC023838 TaxID=3154325 RepID=UPI0033F977FA
MFGRKRRADRRRTQQLIEDVIGMIGPVGDGADEPPAFETVVFMGLVEADDADEYPPRGHGYPKGGGR